MLDASSLHARCASCAIIATAHAARAVKYTSPRTHVSSAEQARGWLREHPDDLCPPFISGRPLRLSLRISRRVRSFQADPCAVNVGNIPRKSQLQTLFEAALLPRLIARPQRHACALHARCICGGAVRLQAPRLNTSLRTK